jgi:GNAT superfamily N-acetyltransferase
VFTRALEPADAQAVSDLVGLGFREHVAYEWEPQAGQEFIAVELIPERLGKMIAESAFTAGAFDNNGELLGVLILPIPTWLALLFVHPRVFRQGIAGQLWDRAREFVMSLSPPVAEVRLNSSTFAIGFYLKAGFVLREPIDIKGRRGTRMVWQVPPRERQV